MSRSARPLRERKLFQWVLTYLAGAWLVYEVLSLVSQNFDWPKVVIQVVTVLLAAGVAVTVVLAWYHGEKGRQRVSGGELVLLSVLVILAATSVGMVARSAPDTVRSRAQPIDLPDRGSIAVLPFADFSERGDQEYFSDGLTEELLNALAHVPGLRVAARTSSFAFRGAAVPVDSIGRALNVAYVVEGSVRRVAERVRITAQLVSTANGYHLWSETYERDLKDVFAVQEEITAAIAGALGRAVLSGTAPRLVRGSTDSIAAHDLYLLGRQAWNRRSAAELQTAVDYFTRAIAIDPEYARAHAALSEVYAVLPGYLPSEMEAIVPALKAAASRAIALEPTLAEPHNALGVLYGHYLFDDDSAEASFRRALQLNPSYANARQWYGEFLALRGHGAEGEAELRRALELDPLSPIIHSDYGQVLYLRRDYGRAVAQLERLVAREPDFAIAYFWLLRAYLALGRYDEAERVAPHAAPLLGLEPELLAFAARAVGAPALQAEALARLKGHPRALTHLARWDLAVWCTYLDDRECALQLAEQMTGFGAYLAGDPAFDAIREHPRFQRAIRELYSS